MVDELFSVQRTNVILCQRGSTRRYLTYYALNVSVVPSIHCMEVRARCTLPENISSRYFEEGEMNMKIERSSEVKEHRKIAEYSVRDVLSFVEVCCLLFSL